MEGLKISEMSKEYILRTLDEERLWKVGESDSFNFGNWNLTLRKEENHYQPYAYSVVGSSDNGISISRRYASMEKAFLHIANNFNENANIRDRYKTINHFITKGD